MVEILFEDNHLLIVVKPHNMPTQADESGDEDLLNVCKKYLKEKYNKEGEAYLGMVHRLDRPTGGIIVFAKTSKCASRLSKLIKEGEVDKNYLAVLEKTPKDKYCTLINYLKKDEENNIVKIAPQLETGAKKAELNYEVLETNDEYCLAKINLITGRSHQIRVQLANIKCPVVGDRKYGDKTVKTKNLMLWAYKISFVHPTTKQSMSFISYPPKEEFWTKFNIDKFLKF